MRYLKGFVFTIDAIFCLIIAASAVTILLYVNYVSPASYEAPVGEAYSIMQALSQTTMQQAAQGELWAGYAVDGYVSRQYQWPEYGNNASLSSSAQGFAPPGPDILWFFKADCPVFPDPVAADGLVFFTTGPHDQCPPASLYGLNATTGNVVLNVSGGGRFYAGPMVYDHMVITMNDMDYLNAFAETGNLLWSTQLAVSGRISPYNDPITMEDGFIEVDSALYYPSNGLLLTSWNGNVPTAYGSGEFVTLNSVQETAYSLSGNEMTQTWKQATGGGLQTTPEIGQNFTIAESGPEIFETSTGGTYGWERTIPGAESQTQGGAAILGDDVFLQTQGGIYGFSAVPVDVTAQILYSATTLNDANTTPSVAQNLLWAVVDDAQVEGLNPNTGATLWNLTLVKHGVRSSYIGDIPLAYGNAYVAVGNTLYAFGTCKADPDASVLQSVAEMYIQGEGACANLILNESYKSNNYAVFINNQYGPSLSTAEFGGQTSFAAVNDSSYVRLSNTMTLSAWIYLYSDSSGPYYVFNKGSAYTLYVTGGGKVEFGDDNGDHSIAKTDVGTQQWVNIVASFNGTYGSPMQGNTAIYYNGSPQKATYSGDWASTGGLKKLLYLGAESAGPANPFNGLLANFQIYNTSLNASQIEQLYLRGPAGLPLNSPNLTAWWPMDGDMNDYSGHYNSGYAYNVVYGQSSYEPTGLATSFSISRAGVPLYLSGPNETSGIYNVSVVNWR